MWTFSVRPWLYLAVLTRVAAVPCELKEFLRAPRQRCENAICRREHLGCGRVEVVCMLEWHGQTLPLDYCVCSRECASVVLQRPLPSSSVII
jgi:hypothetical protein